QVNAFGTLHRNPLFGEPGEPPFRGAIYCRIAERPVRYEVSAWHRTSNDHLDYCLRIGEGLPGVMCRWWDADHQRDFDMEGTVGFDQEYILEAWFVDPERTIILIQIYSIEAKNKRADPANGDIANGTRVQQFI
ncbi:MAG: hypothetical protein ACK40S_14705, partial [Burkholderiaceae bacterium]